MILVKSGCAEQNKQTSPVPLDRVGERIISAFHLGLGGEGLDNESKDISGEGNIYTGP